MPVLQSNPITIIDSLDNINLECVLGTKKNGVYKSFLEDYDKNNDQFF